MEEITLQPMPTETELKVAAECIEIALRDKTKFTKKERTKLELALAYIEDIIDEY